LLRHPPYSSLFPYTTLFRSIPYSDIPVDGSLFTVNFNNPIEVSDEFFTSFRLGDYSHGGLGTKRIAITHAPDGTRPESDFDVYGDRKSTRLNSSHVKISYAV